MFWIDQRQSGNIIDLIPPDGYRTVEFTVTGSSGFLAGILSDITVLGTNLVNTLGQFGYPPIPGSGYYEIAASGWSTIRFSVFIRCQDDVAQIRENLATILEGNGLINNATVSTGEGDRASCLPKRKPNTTTITSKPRATTSTISNSTPYIYDAGDLATVDIHTGIDNNNKGMFQKIADDLQVPLIALGIAGIAVLVIATKK